MYGQSATELRVSPVTRQTKVFKPVLSNAFKVSKMFVNS
jgi:hypothetical protein